MCGPRVEAVVSKDEPLRPSSCRFVLIGTGHVASQRAISAALDACEAPACGEEDVTDVCGACDIDLSLDDDGLASEATDDAATEAPAAFARRLERDTRFEVCWVRGSLVAFRLLAWLGASAEELNSELLAEANGSGSGSGRSWLAPCRDDEGGLVLLRAVCAGVGPREAWEDVRVATEQVMLRRFSGVYCDCLETIAGKALV